MICYLIRHGQDDDSVRGGWSDCPLTELGIQQSTELADNLSNDFEHYNIGKILNGMNIIQMEKVQKSFMNEYVRLGRNAQKNLLIMIKIFCLLLIVALLT